MDMTPSIAERVRGSAAARLPHFTLAVVDRAVQRFAFQAVLAADARTSATIRTAGATLHRLRARLARDFLSELVSACEGRADLPASGLRGDLDICLDESLPLRLDAGHLRDAAELACWAERVRFDALFSTAGGRHVVDGAHVFRPEVFAGALACALDRVPARRPVRAAWFAHMGEPLGAELACLYGALAREMRDAGVVEAEYVPAMVAGRRFEPWAAVTSSPAWSPR